MAKKKTIRRLRRLLKYVYLSARVRPKWYERPSGIPGPAFDMLVVATALVLGVLQLL